MTHKLQPFVTLKLLFSNMFIKFILNSNINL